MAESRIGPEARARIEAAWPELLVAVATGANIGAACEKAGVTRANVYAYQRENAAARADWDLAREQSADAFADQVADIASNPGGNVHIARVQLDALKWLAAKRNPRAYSDKSSVDVNVRTVDLTRIIEHANQRLAAARNPELARRAADAVDAVIVQHALPEELR